MRTFFAAVAAVVCVAAASPAQATVTMQQCLDRDDLIDTQNADIGQDASSPGTGLQGEKKTQINRANSYLASHRITLGEYSTCMLSLNAADVYLDDADEENADAKGAIVDAMNHLNAIPPRNTEADASYAQSGDWYDDAAANMVSAAFLIADVDAFLDTK